ncbi:hypothetical protein IU449_02365 [Nocardia higoensis]|uniref:Integral membrane protein n=1 Tax=Nocardia higoensis TaxID=228599 RepID=A0ABS0D955_9NOCA|nr:hypothetical protein [Nocardia higoensis]MBF6353399.1 hypothetical protein [Nocardia higoensis]
MNARNEAGPPRVGIGEWVARAIAVVLLVPVRLVWEGVKWCGRAFVAVLVFVLEQVLAPVGRFVHLWVIRPLWFFLKDMVWGWAIQQVLWGMVLTPLGSALLNWLLRPLLRVIEQWLWQSILRPALNALLNYVVVPVAKWLGKWVLGPALYAIAVSLRWVWTWCVVRPLALLWRWVLRPLWIALAATLYFGWRGASAIVRVLVVVPCAYLYRHVLRPALAALATVWRTCVVVPVSWVHRTVLMPMNRFAADVLGAVFGR